MLFLVQVVYREKHSSESPSVTYKTDEKMFIIFFTSVPQKARQACSTKLGVASYDEGHCCRENMGWNFSPCHHLVTAVRGTVW